jgi:hypothetical protein
MAEITTLPRCPLTGSAEKATPAEVASIMR